MANIPTTSRAHYSPPWANVTIIGIAGSSGSGKSTLSTAIISALDLPWDSFYKPLTPEQSKSAFQSEYDFDSPNAIDFDILVDCLADLKQGKRAEIPRYSFVKHQREPGIFALYDQRVLEMLDMRIFCEADADTCLARRFLRDVEQRGRDFEGCIKQWFTFVKPNFENYVQPQRKIADIIIPRGIENRVAITMVTQYIEGKLLEKSISHQTELKRLGAAVKEEPLSSRVMLLEQTSQLKGMNTIVQDSDTTAEDFIFYFDRLATLLIEHAINNVSFEPRIVETPAGNKYSGLQIRGRMSAVVILRAGSTFETGLKRVLPDCLTGRLLIQPNIKTGEPELHFLKLSSDIKSHSSVLLLDPQMSSGGAALMAVQILVDHGVAQENIIFVTYFAGRLALNRLTKVFPKVKVVICTIVTDHEERWIEKRYFGC